MIDLNLFSNHLEYFSHSDIPSLILQKKFRASTFTKMSQKIVEIVLKVTTEKKWIHEDIVSSFIPKESYSSWAFWFMWNSWEEE